MKIPIILGLAVGICMSVIAVSNYSFGLYNSPIEIADRLTYIVFLGTLFMSIKLRKSILGGDLSFMTGLKTGLVLISIASTIYGITHYVYFQKPNPKFQEFVVKQNLENYKDLPDKDKEILKSGEQFKPIAIAYNSFGRFFVYGILFSVMFALFLRKKPEGKYV